ncbi:MAG: ATP-binding protein [Planctomycetota bacterium]
MEYQVCLENASSPATFAKCSQQVISTRADGAYSVYACDLIIVEELGYIPLDRIGAEHLFGSFSQCYKQTSLIVTTNLPFVDWPQVLGEYYKSPNKRN